MPIRQARTRVGAARRAANRRLVDVDDLVEVFYALDALPGSVNIVGNQTPKDS